MTLKDELTATKKGRRLWHQERFILDVTETICRLMNEQGVSRHQLAARMADSIIDIDCFLDGQVTMDLRTVSDVFLALGYEAEITVAPIGGKEEFATFLKRGDI